MIQTPTIKDTLKIKIINWLIQILIISNIIVLISSILFNSVFFTNLFIVTYIVLFTIYSQSCFNSEVYRYIKNKRSLSIEEYIAEMCISRPIFNFTSESYHKINNKKGNFEKKITHTKNYNFNYCSFQDISGLFKLDYKKTEKHLIKLELDLDIILADDITKYDYYLIRKSIIQKNKNLDKNFCITENRKILGLEKYNLINLRKEESKLFNLIGFYIFSVFIPLIEFYKIYFNNNCIEQTFKIRKLISTRYDLNSEDNQKLSDNGSSKKIKIVINKNIKDLERLENANSYFKISYGSPTENEIKNSKLFVGVNGEGWNNYLKNKDNFEEENLNKEVEIAIMDVC
jgi:hypothetical protein